MPTAKTHLLTRNFTRGGLSQVKRFVLHTTEGTGSAEQLRDFFNASGRQASIHQVIDRGGNRVVCVKDSDKAWHVVNYNSTSLGIEQVGFAKTDRGTWVRSYHNQLCSVARQLARWHHAHPHVNLAHSVDFGVCQHGNLGAAGGGHWDCGPGYPEAYVIYWARYWYYRFYHPSRLDKRAYYKAKVLSGQRKWGVPLRQRTVNYL